MRGLGELFFELFRISLFVLGGGYSILAVAERRFSRLGWLREGELLDHLPVFQMIPGLIATHTAVYVGRRRAGAVGAFVAVLAVAFPAVAVFTAVTCCYRGTPLTNPWLVNAFTGLRASLTGIIAATVLRSWRRSLPDAFAYSLLVLALAALSPLALPIPAILLTAMLAGTLTAVPARRFRSSPFALLLFAQYGALCFGGGFVLVPMYLRDFVGAAAPYLQLPERAFGDIMALTQMTPGPVGVNCATFFGYALAGIPGAVAASALLLLPGSVLSYLALSSIDRFRANRFVAGLLRGVRPVSIALMLVSLAVFARMSVTGPGGGFSWTGAALVVLTTAAALSRRVNLILLIVLSALVSSLLGVTAGF